MSETPAIDYTSRDFAGFRESLLAYARERMPDWRGATTGDPNDFGVLMAELLAYEGDVLSYYTDRVANEAFLQTAVQRQSVLNHAALLDYTPQSATAATVPVAITVTTTTAAVTIPAGFKFGTTPPDEGGGGFGDSGPGTGAGPSLGSDDVPLVFETTVPITFSASETTDANGDVVPQRQTIIVTAVEGETIEDEVVATLCAGPNESYTLAEAPVIADSVVVRVVEGPNDPGTVWFRVGNLLDAGPNDNAYTLTLDASDAASITMGDGVNGRIAPRGSVLHARYRVGGGAAGNVDDGAITEVIDPDDVVFDQPGSEPGGGGGVGTPGDADGDGIPDASDPDFVDPGDLPENFGPTEVTVINLEPARGGTDSESLESIRANAPRARRTNGRSVSLEDYETLARTVPGVQIAKAKAVAKVYTNVTLYIAPPGGTQPDQRMLNAVVDYLLPRQLAGVTVVAATPTYVLVDVTLHVIVDSRFNQATVKTAVSNALRDVLEFERVGFGERVALSSIYAAAIGVQGVINVVISRLARAGGPAGAADIELAENELPIVGTTNLTAEGGVVNSGDPAGSGVSPTASGAPSIQLIRCDPTSTHIELTWSAGANTTYWEVEVQLRDAAGAAASTTITGPFSFPEAVFDLPRIGAGRATTLFFRTRAYNGNTGPVVSASTTTPYTCE